MKIIYIHQHFCTPAGSTGTRSYDVSRHLADMDHEVVMICGVLDVGGLEKLPWYRFFQKQVIDGIEVIICNAFYSNNFKPWKRKISFLWFAFLASIAALKAKNPDLIFATSTPLTVGIPGYIAAKLKGVPFVFEVRDIWPESFILSGWVTGKELSIRLMARLEEFCYKKAVKILLVSKGFEKRLIERGLWPGKLKTILLGADGNIFRNVNPNHGFLAKHNLKNRIIAIFTGAHGKANGLDYVVKAAELSSDRPDIAYVLIGDGSEKQRLKDKANAKKLDNIVFADAVSKKELPGILAVCHIGLMILKHIEGGRPVTPNKIFDYMFMNMPSIVNFEGPTADMMRTHECGILVDGTQPKDLAQKVKMLADKPHLREQMGQNAKKAAWEKYDRKIIAKELIETFEEILTDYKNRKK